MIHHKRTRCRICGENRLHLFLSLGSMPLANSFLRSPDEFADEAFFPLDVYFCKTCSLVQLLDVIDPEVLFRDYIYVTGTSETIAAHNKQYARTIVDRLKLGAYDQVVEVASNNGSLLKCFKPYGVKTLGIEPAINIAKMASADGFNTINEFFSLSTAMKIRRSYGLSKVVIANNVLAHVDEPQDFLKGCKELLDREGIVVIEVPYLRDLIGRLEYDTIYHEHLCYFSVCSLIRLCDSVEMSIIQIEHVPVHGGSLRIYIGLHESFHEHSKDVLELAEEERRLGLDSLSYYQCFGNEVENNRRRLKDLLQTLAGEGQTIAGYGAPAKGNTLLNFCKIDTHLLPYTVDRNPMKVGLYTPGMHIPIMPVSTLLERKLDFVLILAWNFAEEIMRQQKEYYDRGGRFILPIPIPKVV